MPRKVILDATHKALISLEDCHRLRSLGTAATEAAAIFIERRIEGYNAYQPMDKIDSAPIHDALAVCAVIDPDIITSEFIPVDIETKGELTDGQSVCDFGRRSGKEPNVHFAMDADVPRFKEMIFSILSLTA